MKFPSIYITYNSVQNSLTAVLLFLLSVTPVHRHPQIIGSFIFTCLTDYNQQPYPSCSLKRIFKVYSPNGKRGINFFLCIGGVLSFRYITPWGILTLWQEHTLIYCQLRIVDTFGVVGGSDGRQRDIRTLLCCTHPECGACGILCLCSSCTRRRWVWFVGFWRVLGVFLVFCFFFGWLGFFFFFSFYSMWLPFLQTLRFVVKFFAIT